MEYISMLLESTYSPPSVRTCGILVMDKLSEKLKYFEVRIVHRSKAFGNKNSDICWREL